ncbi:MAG: RNA 2',3'-cyclic phosphodiesterase [Methylococcaceae bacterium]|nr:RNA 2',3'-cyclic phosphodiesterase [Methylococcaceae bacterium]MCI0732545.1 RNA 2',3'-cyclic phosphodiesterase [Methylococcaceae bacterium]
MTAAVSSKRLFFAIWPQKKIRERLERSRKDYCPHIGRWTPAENLHVTLVFLGNVAVRLIPSIEAAVSGIDARAFNLDLDWLRTAPGKGMVWLAPKEVPNELLELVDALKSSLEGLDLEIEKRAYRPHLTLIRKLPAPFEPREIEPIPWPVRSFTLVESRPSRGASEYLRARIWRLRG